MFDANGNYISASPMFKNLAAHEVAEYKEWARENYVKHSEIKGIWHPVIQRECYLINAEEEPNE